MNLAVDGEVGGGVDCEASQGIRGDAAEIGELHPKFGFGVDLVDVLSAGTTGAGIGQTNGVGSDPYAAGEVGGA